MIGTMQSLNWRGTRLIVQPHNVQVGSNQLELRQCFRDGKETGPPLLMLAGFLNTSDVFLPHQNNGGLAPFLASLGYDVYLAELRGRGNGWPAVGPRADWGLHQAICEDIPAHLETIEKLRPGEAQFWLGEGLGGVLLTAAYARLDALSAPLMGLVHLGAARRCRIDSWTKALHHRSWFLGTGLTRLFRGYAAFPFGEASRRETRASLANWQEWQCSDEWLDPVDGFDYREALRRKELPPSLYIANRRSVLWGNIGDCRRWVEELGPHDARLVTVGKSEGNQRNYSHSDLLQHPAACSDHYLQLQAWLEEQTPGAVSPAPLRASAR